MSKGPGKDEPRPNRLTALLMIDFAAHLAMLSHDQGWSDPPTSDDKFAWALKRATERHAEAYGLLEDDVSEDGVSESPVFTGKPRQGFVDEIADRIIKSVEGLRDNGQDFED